MKATLRSRHGRRGPTVSWSREEIIDAIRAFAAEHGRPPRPNEWRLSGGTLGERGTRPQVGTVRARFGTFEAAVIAAGFESASRPTWSTEEILTAIRAFAVTHGRPPTHRDWLRASRPGDPTHPTSAVVVNRFGGSFAAAVVAAGLNPRSRFRVSDEQVVALLHAYVAEHGQSPSSSLWDEAHRAQPSIYPSASTLVNRHGSWASVLALAGLTSAPRIKPRYRVGPEVRWTKEAVIASLCAWAQAHGRAPRHGEWRYAATELAPGGAHPNAVCVCKLWGTWRDGLAAAGLSPA